MAVLRSMEDIIYSVQTEVEILINDYNNLTKILTILARDYGPFNLPEEEVNNINVLSLQYGRTVADTWNIRYQPIKKIDV